MTEEIKQWIEDESKKNNYDPSDYPSCRERKGFVKGATAMYEKLAEQPNFKKRLEEVEAFWQSESDKMRNELREKDEEIERLNADNERYIEILKFHRFNDGARNKSESLPFDLRELH